MKSVLLKIVRFIHSIIGVIMCWGCLLPQQFLYIPVLAFPLVYLQYQFNEYRCILSDLQIYLGDKDMRLDSEWPAIRSSISKITDDSKISDTQIKMGMYGIWILVWSVALYRLVH